MKWENHVISVYKLKYTKVGVLPIQIVKSNVNKCDHDNYRRVEVKTSVVFEKVTNVGSIFTNVCIFCIIFFIILAIIST